MKKIIFLLTIVCFCVNSFSQSDNSFVCRYGFTFEISQQRNWGYTKPVVLTVNPNTSAHSEGLKINDVIEQINGQPTEGQTIETIINWLQNPNISDTELMISNLKEKNKKVNLDKYCLLKNALTEKDLTGIYSFYSLEDAQTRAFECPFKTTTNSDVNLINYKTFGFIRPDINNEQLEKTINEAIRKNLEEKGLKYSDTNPDLIIHTYYNYNKNLNYRKSMNSDKLPTVSRYNMNTKAMEDLPIYYNPLINSNQAEFFLNLGIRLVDRKKSSDNNLFIVWECEANEFLKSNYTLDNYAGFHVPLMLMQYPYPKSMSVAKFYYNRSKYNYTGINYNLDNLKQIVDVEQGSPAVKAGLLPGDVIERINNIKFTNDTKSADNNYKQFIFKTMSLRDEKTQFTNAEGFSRCMYWDKLKYAQISDEFKKPEYTTTFSYLFYFEPYINLSGTNIVSFNIIRDKQKMEIKVQPIIVSEEIFENQ